MTRLQLNRGTNQWMVLHCSIKGFEKLQFVRQKCSIEYRPKLMKYDAMLPQNYGPNTYLKMVGRYDTLVDAYAAILRYARPDGKNDKRFSEIEAHATRVRNRDRPKFFELGDDTVMAVIKYRGGCRCQDPGAHPPCSNCTREITDDELLAVEAIDDTTYYYLGGEPNESEKAP